MTLVRDATARAEAFYAGDDRWTVDERNWRTFHACTLDDELLFPEDARGDEPPYPSEEVKRICNLCPVRAECLQTGLFEPYGIWGGMTGYQRRQLTRPLERATCPGCTSDELIQENGNEICVACGLSWDVI